MCTMQIHFIVKKHTDSETEKYMLWLSNLRPQLKYCLFAVSDSLLQLMGR